MKNVIFHIDDSAMWNHVLNNAQNMINYYHKHYFDYHIKILANSHAVKDLADNQFEYIEEMKHLSSYHVSIVACQNSLKGLNIHPDCLFEFIYVTPSGVVYLADKQFEGYAYIKP